jgi:Rod binding domain-containing protein
MSAPIALGTSRLPLSPPIEHGDNALTSPTTPGNRLPVIDRTKVPAKLREAAEGMEAMFLDYMMKTMRQTVPKSEYSMSNPATEIYQSMMDSETAQKAVRTGGTGLADQLIAHLMTERYNLGNTAEADQVRAAGAQHAAAPSSERTGGTHERE